MGFAAARESVTAHTILSDGDQDDDARIPLCERSCDSSSVSYPLSRKWHFRGRTNKKELEPLPIRYVRDLIYFAHLIPASVTVSRVTTSVQNGQNVKCYLAERGGFASEFSGYGACFEAVTGMLVSTEWSFNTERHRFEYSDFVHEDKKFFPGTMRGPQRQFVSRSQSGLHRPCSPGRQIVRPSAECFKTGGMQKVCTR